MTRLGMRRALRLVPVAAACAALPEAEQAVVRVAADLH